ncbi:MAG TPA: murein biosynthesis integral membrane protein MurJ [Actinomycetota bacterium]|nr:murein biosynthesis integral membrane protein MurJ [Actinomycetota bacterium]
MGTTRRSLARGAAAMTGWTALSRLTGFVRVVVVAAAMGTTFLANTYQTANTVPNVLFELLAAGVLTSVFVPTFVEYIVAGRTEEGWRAADVLATTALVGLCGIAALLALGAPLVMRALTLGVSDPALRAQQVELGTAFLRLFSPQVVLYGAGMVMTGALHAHRRFALAAAAPIFNNLVVIAVYLGYALLRGDRPPSIGGITTAQTLLLGAGTTAGVAAMILCLIPGLRALGWRYTWRWDLRHPALARAASLGAWSLGYAGGYQAGLVVVLLLANRIEGGVAAYQWAYTFFYVPHALFGVPIFNALFPAMAEHATIGDTGSLAARVRDGMAMVWFILVPIALFLVVAAEPLAHVTLEYGVMTEAGAALVGRVLSAFALGLPTYSSFLVLTRAFYALGDTKRPALVNAAAVAVASGAGALLFVLAPARWSVAGLALGHSAGFALGAIALALAMARRLRTQGASVFGRPAGRAALAAAPAGLAMWAAARLVPVTDRGTALAAVALTAAAGAGVYLAVAARLESAELSRLTALARGRAR